MAPGTLSTLRGPAGRISIEVEPPRTSTKFTNKQLGRRTKFIALAVSSLRFLSPIGWTSRKLQWHVHGGNFALTVMHSICKVSARRLLRLVLPCHERASAPSRLPLEVSFGLSYVLLKVRFPMLQDTRTFWR